MPRKLIKQKYFVAKELRLSIALIIIWSLLVTAFFTYFATEFGEKIGSSNLLFAIVMLGYVAIVVVLTLLFSHRLIGPFQRLQTDMRLIRAGDYHKRLNVRNSDDIYIRTFIKEVNNILEDFENVHQYRDEMIKLLDSELAGIITLIEEGKTSQDKLRERVLAVRSKIKPASAE